MGFAYLTLRPTPYGDGPVAELEELYVRPELRNHGIGSRLLGRALEQVRQRSALEMRVGIDEVTTEFPAGGIEEGETPLDAAKRELREETGSVAARWTDLGSLYANPTMGTSRAHCFLAEDCETVTAQELDATECVVYLHLTEAELRRAIEDGSFAQAVHLVLYYRVKELREGR